MQHAERRPLPDGHTDDHGRYFIPRNLRSYYVTVTIYPTRCPDAEHARALDAACKWALREHKGRGIIPGGDLT